MPTTVITNVPEETTTEGWPYKGIYRKTVIVRGFNLTDIMLQFKEFNPTFANVQVTRTPNNVAVTPSLFQRIEWRSYFFEIPSMPNPFLPTFKNPTMGQLSAAMMLFGKRILDFFKRLGEAIKTIAGDVMNSLKIPEFEISFGDIIEFDLTKLLQKIKQFFVDNYEKAIKTLQSLGFVLDELHGTNFVANAKNFMLDAWTILKKMIVEMKTKALNAVMDALEKIKEKISDVLQINITIPPLTFRLTERDVFAMLMQMAKDQWQRIAEALKNIIPNNFPGERTPWEIARLVSEWKAMLIAKAIEELDRFLKSIKDLLEDIGITLPDFPEIEIPINTKIEGRER